MNEPVIAHIDGKQIAIYGCGDENAPIVYANMYMEAGRDVLDGCGRLGCAPFHLVSISGLCWDEELSPWPHEPVVDKSDHFTGEADGYARRLAGEIIPYVEKEIKNPAYRVIAGYSMGGLFALYAPFVTDAFSRAVSASGSVWYPSFVTYVREHEFRREPDAIYLSLGDRESATRNKYLQKTEQCMRDLCSIYRGRGIRSVFELNPGDHYKDAAYRLAKGIAWALGGGGAPA